MADFIVTSGIRLSGNIYGADNITANSISIANTGVFGNLRVRGLITGNIVGTISSLDNFTTSNLIEGLNLYFTNSRAVTAITPILTTANVVENTNLYFTNTRVLSALATSNVTVNNLTVSGDLYVQGNTVTLNAATLVVEDKNILLANGAPNAAAADGAGITVAGADASINYASTGDKFVVNKPVDVQGNLNVTGAAFVNSDPVITLNPLNQSLALLRAQLEASPQNVLYVAKHGDDNNSGSSMSNAIANIHVALNRANAWTTVFVKSGDYTLYNHPVTIKQRVGMVGDNLRTTTIRPSNVTTDMFYVENASYVTGITFRDHQSPSAVFSYNPDGSAGFIVTSPYIQNCSSITTTGCGMRVNGAYVQGLRSMVCDSYTQTNTGGIGIHMLNRGYTQLVSVFTICCHIAILAENGGFCSVTNSNSSFGNYGLVADGVSEPLKFGKVVGDTTGSTFTINNINVRPNYRDAVLFANYDQAKCLRDTKLIVDSLAIDLAYGSNSQSTFSALQYWSQVDSAIPNQSTQIIDALDYLSYLAYEIASNADPLFSIYRANTNILPVSGPTGTVEAAEIVQSKIALVSNIIASGTVGVTDRIISNQYPPTDNPDFTNAANVILLNKDFMAAEIIGYIDVQYPGFFDQANNFIDPANARATCSRDIGFIIDCAAFDLLHGGNRQSIQAGTYYYTYNANDTQINDQVVQTGKAYDYIASLVGNIVLTSNVAKSYQNLIGQNTTAASAATPAQANAVLNNISLIKNIITNGPSVAPAKRPISYYNVTDSNVINAVELILANKDYIAAEVVSYVNQNWANISNGATAFYTVASSTEIVGNTCTITLLETVPDTIMANSAVSFHIPSYIQTSTHTFEYIGAGTDLALALPYNGGTPIQANEVKEYRGGAVYFTSTDQQGDFRIGKELLINRVDGTITGRTFNKSLFAVMTPYLLAIEG